MTEEIGIKNFGEQWYRRLKPLLESKGFEYLGRFISGERMRSTVYPSKELVFRAFRETPFNDVKVVMLGQDPYNTPEDAIGLAFANPNDKIVPQPSLKNILLEVENDVYGGFDFNTTINFELLNWANQGVLLLNTSLTVRKKEPGSHSTNWRQFTESVIKALDEGHSGLVFLLWGKHAQSFEHLLTLDKHHILKCGHPVTPAYGKDTWFGNKHFSKTNELLKQMNGEEAMIKW